MMFLLLGICILALAGGLWHLAARPKGRGYGSQALWRLACLMGAVRIGALWLGAAGLSDPGWPQVFGYFLLMLTLPEVYVARSVRANLREWVLVGTGLLAVTSFAWAAVLIWVADRLRPRKGAPSSEQ